MPGKSHGQRILVGCRLWGRTESDTTEVTAAAAAAVAAAEITLKSNGEKFIDFALADFLRKHTTHSNFSHGGLLAPMFFFQFNV